MKIYFAGSIRGRILRYAQDDKNIFIVILRPPAEESCWA